MKRLYYGLAIVALAYFVAIYPLKGINWLAWNVFTKEFEALCVDYPYFTGASERQYRAFKGPYTQEFYKALKEYFDLWHYEEFSKWGIWQEDGSLRVPIGFDFTPEWVDALGSIPDGARERDWSIELSYRAADLILDRREEEGVDLSAYAQFAFSSDPSQYPSRIRPDTCGFMEELITVGGALARK